MTCVEPITIKYEVEIEFVGFVVPSFSNPSCVFSVRKGRECENESSWDDDVVDSWPVDPSTNISDVGRRREVRSYRAENWNSKKQTMENY